MNNIFKKLIFLSLLITVVLISSGFVSAEDTNTTEYNYTGPADSPSPGYNGVNGTGQSNYTGPQTNNTKYNETISSDVPSDLYIVIGSDGTIYGAKDNKVYAFYANNGSVKWNYTLDTNNAYYPAIGNNETIYVFSSNKLYALHYNGINVTETSYLVENNANDIAKVVPVIGADGTIYLYEYTESRVNYLIAVQPNGTQWSIQPSMAYAPLAIGSNGYLYVGGISSSKKGLFIVDPTDYNNYRNILTDYRIWSITVANDGTIYVVGDNSSSFYLIALYPNETVKWISVELKSLGYSQTATGGANGANTGRVISVSKTGLIYLSNFIIDATNGDILSINPYSTTQNIPIGADGTIYVAGNNNVSAFTSAGVLLWSYLVDGAYNPVIGADGTLYFTAGNQLYAIADDVVPPVVDVGGVSGSYFDDVVVNVGIDDGVVYYTVDGTDPKNSTTRILLVGSSIVVNESCVLKFIGYDADAIGEGQYSNVTTLNYVLNKNFVAGNASISTGSYYNDLTVTLPSEDGLILYYKVNNGVYHVYSGPISITGSSTLSYYYEDANGNHSSVKSYTYNINKNYVPGNPSVTAGSYNKNLKISIPSQSGKTLYYKIGSGSYKVYTGSIAITSTSTISYYFKDSQGKNSKVKTVKYTIDKTSPKVLDKNTKSYKKVKAKKQTLKIKFSENVKISSKNLKKIIVKTSKGKKVSVKFTVKNNYLYMKIPKVTKKTKYYLIIPKNIVSDKLGNLLKSKTTLRYISV